MLLIFSLFFACGETACTKIGCMSGLTLVIKDSYGGEATNAQGTVTVDGEEYTFDCASQEGAMCDNGTVYLPIPQAEMASYEITMGDEYASGVLELNFETSTPNGEGCEPVCYNDEQTVELFRSFE